MNKQETPKPRILIVDDDAIILTVIKRYLKRTNQFDIEIVEDAQSGLALVESRAQFAVVISDMALVGANGVQFLKRVKELSPKTSCIILSGFLSNGEEQEILKNDFIFGTLAKPCTGQELFEMILRAIEVNN